MDEPTRQRVADALHACVGGLTVPTIVRRLAKEVALPSLEPLRPVRRVSRRRRSK
jgi:hypothetical protein